MNTDRREWHIVTCEYPPAIGGVADYTARVASALARTGETVHVWCPGHEPDQAAADGVTVHRQLGTFSPSDCVRAGRLMNAYSNRRLLVQWVPHGYGYKSLNVPFAFWLAWRAWVRGDDLQLMIHEPYMRETWPPAYVAASLIERVMLWMIGVASSRAWLSTPSWLPFVQPYVRRGIPLEWLPVPAPLDGPPTPLARRTEAGAVPVVGHFSTHSPVVTAILAPALDAILRNSTASVLLMGRDSERFRAALIERFPAFAPRVTATGVLDARDIAVRMRGCDVMLQPYPDGITTRNTSMLLALSSGACVVSNAGPLTEQIWKSKDAVALAPGVDPVALAALTMTLLKDPERRAATADRGARLYREVFDITHAAAALTCAINRTIRPASRDLHAET
jgi:glycosyltransferase involved in cell wall biosynthesis